MELNAAHVHLLLNHVPILGSVAAVLLLTLALLFRREVLTKAGLWTLGVSGVVALPVYLSGEEAEDIVEELGAPHAVIEPHEEAALVALIVLGLLAVAALAVLWWLRAQPEVPRWVTVATWALAVVGAALAARTAYLGGQIRHTEIRPPEVRQQLEAAPYAEDGQEVGSAGESGGTTSASAAGSAGQP